MPEGLSNVNEKRRWPQIAGAETHPYFSGWEVGGGGGAAIFVPWIMLLLMLHSLTVLHSSFSTTSPYTQKRKT
jgi:hypothetical protein